MASPHDLTSGLDLAKMASQVLADPGAYTMQEWLGAGTSGTVYAAVENATGRRVAVKVLHATGQTGLLAGPDYLAWRLRREAEAVASLDHPGIVKLLAADFDGPGPARLVMEYVSGPDLDEWCRTARDLRARLQLFAKIADAIGYANLEGILHRDVKPANILVDVTGAEPEPRVVDFGLARFVQESGLVATLTQDGQALGTPLFMSPEQARGESAKLDSRTDVYALGVVLFRMVTDASPCGEQASSHEVLRAVAEGKLLAPRQVQPGIDRDLDAIICKAMAHRRTDRYASAADLAADVRAFLENRPVSARRGSAWYVLRKHLRRHWRTEAVLMALLLTAAGAAAWHLREISRRNAVAEAAYREARSLLEFQVTETVGWMRDAGRHDVVADLADRALAFPWDLPVSGDWKSTGGRSSEEIRAVIAGLEADAFERGHDPATALKWRMEALELTRKRATAEPGNPVAAWEVLSAEAGVLINRISLHQLEDPAKALRDWLLRAESLASTTATLTVPWIDAATGLLMQTVPELIHPGSSGEWTPVLDRLLAAYEGLSGEQKLIVRMGFAKPRLLQTKTKLLFAESDLAAAEESSAMVESAWREFLKRFPRHVDANTALRSALLLRSEILRQEGKVEASLALWQQARDLLRSMEENFLFTGGSAAMEELFRLAIPLAESLQKAGFSAETIQFFNKEIIPLFDGMSALIPAERKKLDEASQIPDLWPLLLRGHITTGLACLATGDKAGAFLARVRASSACKDLARWNPEDPAWLIERAEILVELLSLPIPAGQDTTPERLRTLISSVIDQATVLHPDAAGEARLSKLRAAAAAAAAP